MTTLNRYSFTTLAVIATTMSLASCGSKGGDGEAPGGALQALTVPVVDGLGELRPTFDMSVVEAFENRKAEELAKRNAEESKALESSKKLQEEISELERKNEIVAEELKAEELKMKRIGQRLVFEQEVMMPAIGRAHST